GGGTSRNRMHSARDYTGLEIMRVLRDEARNLHIPVVEFSPAIELLCDERGHVAGAVLVNLETKRYQIVRAKATIITTGGLGRLHMQQYPTTNHYGATADGLVLAYRVGAQLVDLDAIQYHPTGAAFPAQMAGLLITEKVRGLGAQPLNAKGEQFVYPLEPRDVEASAFIRECSRDLGIPTPHGIHGVWLDAPMVDIIHGPGTIRSALPAMFRMYTRFGIDMTRDPILVFPTLHYQNGGIITDADGATTVPGLYAAGEVMGGVHGKNRLMGNSLLDFNVFGRRAGIAAANYVRELAQPKHLSLAHVATYEHQMRDAGVVTTRTAPRILPDYRGKEALERYLDIPL
ncbi:MAG: FAD-binding protein, partial [Candidatus Viridilinea halotolerans]